MVIRLEIENKALDLYENTGNNLAQTFQVQDINGASVVSSSFSTTISIPLTQNNRQIFDFEFVSGDDKNYKVFSANLLINGIPVLSVLNGGSCVIEEIYSNKLDISLYSNNFNLFSAISQLNISDLSVDLSHDNDYESVKSLYNNVVSDGYTYAQYNSGISYYTGGFPSLRVLYQEPVFFVKYFFEKIFQEQGFTVSGSFFTDSDFEELGFSSDSSKRNVRGVGVTDIPSNFTVGTTPVGQNITRQLGIDTFGDINGLPAGLVNTSLGLPVDPNKVTSNSFLGIEGVKTKVRFTCSLSIAYSPSPPSFNQTVLVRLHSTKKGVLASQSLSSSIVDVDISANITLEDDEAFFVTYAALNAATGEFAIITITEQERFEIGYYDYNEYKPSFNQLDLVKFVMNRYDLIATVDYINNVVDFKRFDDVKNDSVDWSDKISLNKEYKFDIHPESLGQSNTLEYNDGNFSGNLVINDSTLNQVVSYYKSIFFSCQNAILGRDIRNSIDVIFYNANTELISGGVKTLSTTELQFDTLQNIKFSDGDIIRIFDTEDYNKDFIVNGNQDLNNGTIVNVREDITATDEGFQAANVFVERTRDNDYTNDSQPCVFKIKNESNTLFVTDLLIEESTVSTFKILQFETQNMSFQYAIDNYYINRTESLNAYKLLKAYFKLNELDVQQLDFRKAIYVNATDLTGRQINGFFYLNKVDQYKADQLTRCELLKL